MVLYVIVFSAGYGDSWQILQITVLLSITASSLVAPDYQLSD